VYAHTHHRHTPPPPTQCHPYLQQCRIPPSSFLGWCHRAVEVGSWGSIRERICWTPRPHLHSPHPRKKNVHVYAHTHHNTPPSTPTPPYPYLQCCTPPHPSFPGCCPTAVEVGSWGSMRVAFLITQQTPPPQPKPRKTVPGHAHTHHNTPPSNPTPLLPAVLPRPPPRVLSYGCGGGVLGVNQDHFPRRPQDPTSTAQTQNNCPCTCMHIPTAPFPPPTPPHPTPPLPAAVLHPPPSPSAYPN